LSDFPPWCGDNARTGQGATKALPYATWNAKFTLYISPRFGYLLLSMSKSMTKKLHIKTWGCQMNEYDSS
ncbi:hypothetical protein ACLBTQ_36675, partial [Pseudomonas aeruginosa]|uniref:hypothetical protein n=1 Tax=Pseudomonas aeruginosa TaxID=287 RepID=UPI0039699DC5